MLSADPVLLMTSIATSAVGIIGGWSAVSTYKRNQTLKRQEVLLPLMKEFDTDKNIFYAKELIDRVPVQIKDEKENFNGNYTYDDLKRLLNEVKGKELDKDEITMRIVIDSLLNFFGKLAYLIEIKILTRQDIVYFEYYVRKATQSEAVMHFARRLEYELFLLLLDQTGYIDDESHKKVVEYKKRIRQKYWK
jgi:hypothetical protein